MIGAASNIGFLLTRCLFRLYLNASLDTVSGWIGAIGLVEDDQFSFAQSRMEIARGDRVLCRR